MSHWSYLVQLHDFKSFFITINFIVKFNDTYFTDKIDQLQNKIAKWHSVNYTLLIRK